MCWVCSGNSSGKYTTNVQIEQFQQTLVCSFFVCIGTRQAGYVVLIRPLCFYPLAEEVNCLSLKLLFVIKNSYFTISCFQWQLHQFTVNKLILICSIIYTIHNLKIVEINLWIIRNDQKSKNLIFYKPPTDTTMRKKLTSNK